MRENRYLNTGLIIAVALVIMLAAGCNPQPLPVEPTPIPTLIPATLPASAGAASPSDSSDPQQQGAAVFDANCSSCHYLTAERKVGPGLAGLFDLEALPNGQTFSEESLGDWILNGSGAMPGIPVSEAELEALIAFLRDATE